MKSFITTSITTLIFLFFYSVQAQPIKLRQNLGAEETAKGLSNIYLTESNLPIIIIDTDDVTIPDDPKIEGHMGIIWNGEGQINHVTDSFNNYDGKIGIEIRGHSSQMFPKKSYGFETRDNEGEDLEVSLLGLPEDSDWVLYAPYTDKSMLRNVMTFHMGHLMGDSYGSRTLFCELIINDDYKGVYVLMEKIKKGEYRVDINSLKPDEVSGDAVTGGYILSVDWEDEGFTLGRDGWLSSPDPSYPNAKDITFQFDYPASDKIVEPQRNYIKGYVTAAERALIGSNFTNPAIGWNKYFDAPSFVDFMLLNEISKEVDKYRYSQFFFKQKDSDGGKLFAGPAWDFNLGYGNVDYWTPGIQTWGWVYTDVQPVSWSIIYFWKRLMEDPYFRDLARTRWNALREGPLNNQVLESSIDSIVSFINEAQVRNYERWPILGEYVWPNYDWQGNTYEDEVDFFENFLFARLQWMDNNLQGSVLHPEAGITAEGNKIRLFLWGDRFRNNVLKADHFLLNNAPESLSVTEIEYINPSECILTLSSDVTQIKQLSVTINEKAINTWEDITTSTLESSGIEKYVDGNIKVWATGKTVVIRTEKPETLPTEAEVFHISGRTEQIFRIEQTEENILFHDLHPGVYMLVLKGVNYYRTYKFIITE